MGLSAHLLGQGETEVLHLRTHIKALIWPAIVVLLVAVATGLALAWVPVAQLFWAGWLIGAVAVVALIGGALVPFVRWWTATYTFTNRRIITRHGIITKRGHDLPLSRIANVAYEQSLTDRMFGCGTLQLTTSAEEPVTLHDIPDVERVHVVMTELLFNGGQPVQSAQPGASTPEQRDE